ALAAEQARQPSSLTDDEVRWLSAAGADIRAVFDAPSTTPRERKQLIRAVISEITVTADRQARTAALTIYWEGGASSSVTVPRAPPPPLRRRPRPPPGRPPRRPHARGRPPPPGPAHRNRAGIHQDPRRGPAPRPRHPRRAPQECHPGRPR